MDGTGSVDISAGLAAADPAKTPSYVDALTAQGSSGIQKTEKAQEALAKRGEGVNEHIFDMLAKQPVGIDPSKLPEVKAPKETPAPKPPQPRDALENFGSWASVLGILGGAVLHAPISASLDASAAAMKAATAGDWQKYDVEYARWKDQSELAWKQADFQSKAFDRALNVMKTNMAQGQWLITELATQFGYTPAQQIALAQAPQQAAELQIKLADAANQLKESSTKIQVQGELLKSNRDLAEAQKSGDPAKIMAAQQAHMTALENFQSIFAPASISRPVSVPQLQSQAAQLRIQAGQYPVGSQERAQLESQAKSIEDSISQTKGGAAAQAKPLLSPEAVRMNAEIYLQTHEMPSLGMGNQGDRAAIQNKAAELAQSQGLSVQDIISGKAQYKADTASLTNIQKMADSARQYERTMLDNINIARGLMNKGEGTSDGPVVNRWIQAGRRATGDPDVAALNAALQTVALEYARVQSGTTGSQARLTDSARDEAQELLSKFDSPEAINETIERVIIPDTQNKIAEAEAQAGSIRERIGASGNRGEPKAPAELPKNQSDWIDGKLYSTAQGPGVWNAAKRRFDRLKDQ